MPIPPLEDAFFAQHGARNATSPPEDGQTEASIGQELVAAIRIRARRVYAWLKTANLRLKYWHEFSLACAGLDAFTFERAHHLESLATAALSNWMHSPREDLRPEHFQTYLSHILSAYGATISAFQAIQRLTLLGYGLECMTLLRVHLESTINLLYLLEPSELATTFERTDEHRDWTIVQMSQNAVHTEQFLKSVGLGQYYYQADELARTVEEIQAERGMSNKAFKEMFERRNSFLKYGEQKRVARDAGLSEVFSCVHAEGSGDVHGANLGDRGTWTDSTWTLKMKTPSVWPLLAAFSIQAAAAISFIEFFQIKHLLLEQVERFLDGKD